MRSISHLFLPMLLSIAAVSTFAHDQLVTSGVESKGLLHVRIEIPDPLLVTSSEGKEYV